MLRNEARVLQTVHGYGIKKANLVTVGTFLALGQNEVCLLNSNIGGSNYLSIYYSFTSVHEQKEKLYSLGGTICELKLVIANNGKKTILTSC